MAVFRVERSDRGIAHLIMDDPRRSVNVFDEESFTDLESALNTLEGASDLTGVVVRSGKPGTFIAGADVDAIGSLMDREKVLNVVRRAHVAFGRLASLSVPTVAAIDGVCLGGGTELALACDSRVASQEARTQIGLPETLLGIIPGFGGTTRLPRLVGLSAALDMILTGRNTDARKAKRIGLIWKAVPAAWLVDYAEQRVIELSKKSASKRRDRFRPKNLMQWALDGNPFGRSVVLSQARKMTEARTGGNYPAPEAALQVIERGLPLSVDRNLELEAQWTADLVITPVCKNLVRIFKLQERAKKDAVVADATIEPQKIHRMMLIGTGIMGAGVAELASRNGIEVRMRDISAEALTRAMNTVKKLIDTRGRRRRLPKAQTAGQLSLVYPTLELAGVRRAEFAMEAVIEDLDIKRKVFAELEVRMEDDAVLATNTSSLSVDALASGLNRPERFCGFHFFNPVHRMPLVEVVRGAKTSDATLVSAVELARRLGKTPVVVADSPGFVVNRILMPYLSEAMVLLEEGYPLVDIDKSMRLFGMPMGPFEVVDEVGLDVARKVAGVLSDAFPDRMTPSPSLDKLIAAGRLGRKNGRGFYRHGGKKREPDPSLAETLGLSRERKAPNLDVLAERMVLAIVNEAARCVEEEVAADAGVVDLAMIFGAGFPPFRGGPLRYADTLGLQKVAARLTAFYAERGPRFEPAKIIQQLAQKGETFTQPILPPEEKPVQQELPVGAS